MFPLLKTGLQAPVFLDAISQLSAQGCFYQANLPDTLAWRHWREDDKETGLDYWVFQFPLSFRLHVADIKT